MHGGLDKTVQSMHVGGEAAVKAMSALPETRHDISGPTDKFVLDSFPVPLGNSMALLVSLHGQFTEVEVDGVRSFDRTFVLAPAPDGSRYVHPASPP
jgi:nuclear RNA export factor